MIANRYSLDREIGRGGMGAVWLGRDELLGRRVAVKRVGRAPGRGYDSESDHQRAEREARIAASLNHPHVVAIFDLVDDHEEQWLVMEYVEGRSLAQVVREDGPLDHDRAAAVVADAARALATAHAEGVVHRDVKPSNILLTQTGEAKLLDFGIARAQGDMTLTQTGLVSGSPAYLAPEVASGLPSTGASDVWSLGATLFHLLSGHPPYDVGDNVVGGLYRIVHEEPPTLDDPGWLRPLLESTMVRDPNRRWTMSHVAAFLGGGSRLGAAGAGTVAAARPPDQPTREGDATRVVPQPTAAAPALAPAATAAPGSGNRRGGLLALTVVVVALLLAIGYVLLQPDEQTGGGVSADGSPGAAAPSTPPSEDPTAREAPNVPTAAAMSTFIGDYLETAASDPTAAFQMLTPEFQAQSNGLEGYTGFWGQVTDIEQVDITEADPDTLQVGYRYTYRTSGGDEPTEDVRLQLRYDAGRDRYLIADET